MARTPKAGPGSGEPPVTPPDGAIEPPFDPVLEPPPDEPEEADEAPWMRGLHMLLFAILFEIAKWLLLIAALMQFLWLLFAKEKNTHIADFGENLSRWLARVARFQTAATEDRPFPWRRWGE